MDSDTLASALALLGTVGGFGLLGALIGREVTAQKATGRDNWHRQGGYPVDPARPDRLYGTMPAASLRPSADPATADPVRSTTSPTGADAGPPLTVLPGGSGRLAGWTSSSARPSPRSSRKPAA
ncbi:hypothetical protein [Kitasatospora purpeofusca]|uniref:hypothetical protein n=1 Tax=Kitasatospora purpeofusca TaxID=67352 RepID=UPI003867CEBD|nr:hypothetical protein OIP63_23615 [Kitasatospora purpeofusca]